MNRPQDANPTIFHTFRLTNPDYRVDDESTYWVEQELEAEVLTLHLNSMTMRVRYIWEGRLQTQDIPIDNFFNKYSIVEKG